MANLLCPLAPTIGPNLKEVWKHNGMPLVMQKKCRSHGKFPQILAFSRPRSDSMRVYAAARTQKQNQGTGSGAAADDFGAGAEAVQKKRSFSYMFQAENGGLVKVAAVAAVEGMKYMVSIEASSCSEKELFLSYGIFRSDSSRFKCPTGDSEGTDSKIIPFVRESVGRHRTELEFGAAQSPFYLSFLLHSSSDASDAGIRTHKMARFCVPVGLGPGHPFPFGISSLDDGMVNFSLFSKNAESVVLCLFDGDASNPSLEIELDPYVNHTGGIWHVALENDGKYVSYGYRCKGLVPLEKESSFPEQCVLLDPYAKFLAKSLPDRGETVPLAKCLGSLKKVPIFDWGQDAHPCLPLEKLVVYRLDVERFSKHESCELLEDVAGTFAGVVEKMEHLKALGINAILLEPIFPFDEQKGPYFPYHFFSPEGSFGQTNLPASAINSLKGMIKTLHAHAIEVLLEVAFTHTCENGDSVPQMISFAGIDMASYYISNGKVESGDVSALKCYNPVVQQLILDSLKHWVVEFHVDGFCFINSSFLAQGPNGEHLSRPPLLEAIAYEPVLSKAKIIADSFCPLDISYTEIKFPHWKRWCEMNTRFCRDVRKFLRGEELISNFATRLCGSGDIFSSRGPAFSFNYITRSFGLSLVDLVSFSSSKLAPEFSWNCGEEGPTNNDVILETRLKQIRNFLFILFVSLGIPVLSMGDESGYSTGGSLSYNDRKSLDWSTLKTSFGRQITQFIAFLSSLRIRRADVFQNKNFLKVESITWYGSNQSQPIWNDPANKFLAVALKSEKNDEMLSLNRGDLFICFNVNICEETTILPEQPEGTVWSRIVDTSLPFPGFFSNESDPDVYCAPGLSTYDVKSHSCALFEAKRADDRSERE